MVRVSAATILCVVVTGIAALGQAPTPSTDGSYVFIDTPKMGWRAILKESVSAPGGPQILAVSEKLTVAGAQSCGFQLLSRSALSLAMLLKHDGGGPRTYRILATPSDKDLLRGLNEAAAEGFKLLPEGAKIFNRSQEKWKAQWVGVVAQETNGDHAAYTMVKGTGEAAERALAEARARGAVLVASFGHPFGGRLVLILDESAGRTAAPAPSGDRQYRILSTDLTSTLEKEVQTTATQGFRVVGAGAMAVVMERDTSAAAQQLSYKVLATRRVGTLQKELSAAGAEGFRVAAVADHADEFALLLERSAVAADRFEYMISALSEATAGTVLTRAEADGYQGVVLIENYLVLQRSRAQTLSRVMER